MSNSPMPGSMGEPRNQSVWVMNMYPPTPTNTPRTTEKGSQLANLPRRRRPKAIWMSPAIITIVNASARLSAYELIMTAVNMVIRALGPEIMGAAPPSTAVKNPTAIAP